ncbi:penicillin-binding protein 1A [Amphritea balenae]|uniref:Penicillin-binding protein 1A n=1 Tax=Amphritea balenae TaxID=452629 RepID=A0A3P1SIZ0_9GAMM|nr:penicillin-binding protein 1A [Amphritea balenae]RRC97243.1 penicillin-binding protein 1A [Amphritea balenae]GGK64419.1 penicillin-binding protein 1A [Amphritea balenae]
MKLLTSLLKLGLKLTILGCLLGGIALAGAYYYLAPKLPDVQTLKVVKLQTPLRIYSEDNQLISEFGEKRRTPIQFEQIPDNFINALLAAEDRNFFNHIGIDIKGLARAAFQLASTGHIQSGGSTITMQVAKNFFLTRERSFLRKFNEILLSLQIEQELSKEEILELYINKIYLGHRSYGIQAAANIYYGMNIDQLSLAQHAMIAGLPKAPSAYNPITNPSRALERRNWILKRMHSLSFINDEDYETARTSPVTAEYHGTQIDLYAPYVAEMVRNELYQYFDDRLYSDGLRVYTTLNSEMQTAANKAVEDGLLAYTERHGYFGPEQKAAVTDLSQESIVKSLKQQRTYGSLSPAIVLETEKQQASVYIKGIGVTSLAWEEMNWAQEFKGPNRTGKKPKQTADIFSPGDLIRVRLTANENWRLSQIPKVQGAFTALSPDNGAIKALVGGFNFNHNKFNRATQAQRQPGSNLKPFIYASALEQGYTPATLINDAPVVFHDTNLESNWRPENYSKKFYGPTRLREALYKSRNLVSIRILRSIGIDTATEFLTRFGFDKTRLPNNLSLSLGSADVTPLELVTGYAGLANQGFKVNPFFIDRIEDSEGNTLYQAQPMTVCSDCVYSPDASEIPSNLTALQIQPETDSDALSIPLESDQAAEESKEEPAEVSTNLQPVSGQQITTLPLAERTMQPHTAFMIYNIMQDVITRGTGRRALALKRTDIAGKTGTTNDQKDAWFSGFNSDVVATAWVGFDQPSTLGRREFGGTAALPIWIDFMKVALSDSPDLPAAQPDGMTSVRIDPKTGLLAYPGQENALFEVFPEDSAPTDIAPNPAHTNTAGSSQTDEIF